MSRSQSATIAWVGFGAASGIIALLALLEWARALVAAGPVLYGEGAVAHAAILTRTFATYADVAGSRFVAANYPPVYFIGSAFGDPFVSGRLLSIAATLSLAGLIGWRARAGGLLVALALALGWLALTPVTVWGPAVKPDPLALALSAGAVLALEGRKASLAGVLIVLAIFAKPTAIIVLIALLIWSAARDAALLRRLFIGTTAALAVAAIALIPFGYDGLWRHVVSWNALPWDAGSALLLLGLGVVIHAAPIGGNVLGRAVPGPIRAYGIAALVVVLLGGREGATINYLLDLGVAGSLGLAAMAQRLRRSTVYPVAAVAGLALAALLIVPLGVPGRTATTGAWGDPTRLSSIRSLLDQDELVLAEDSGLLVATGHRVLLDDLFLWSRLVAHGTIDPGPVLEDVRIARYGAIVTEVELARLTEAPGFERARWDPSLVRAIDTRYRLVSRLPSGLFLYRPR
ncbi:MAG: hypothetical protein NVSMB8_04860 [Candidatus Limnocylindrales bacterium]